MNCEQEMNRIRDAVNRRLDSLYNENKPQKTLLDAMKYSLMAGGKRIRPALVIAFCKAAGGNEDDAMNAACAVEMLHTYSLIHDDLPCMDNDELRRGKPTNHVVFGECMATLAGDSLQADAFGMLLGSALPPERVAAMGRILAEAAGSDGICGGQTLDMLGEGKSLTVNEVERIHRMKTAAMLIASAKLGVVAAGGDTEMIDAAEKYADALGLAFQVRDDVLDAIGDEETFGKPIGSDAENGKTTFATLYGVEMCEEIVLEQSRAAAQALEGVFCDTEFLSWLAMSLAKRNY
ncbi:MAG: polyprenyl synthetase family protein [Oscillospiraceae bacterium]|nr:polyprenyl synthetase family protein [Oscillospiraceae bacterium]